MKNGDKGDNKLIVPVQKAKKTIDKTGKLVVSSLKTFVKKNNIKVNKKYVVGILGVIVLIIIGANIFSDKGIDYPVVFNNSDGNLYLMNTNVKKEEDAAKLAKSENVSNVVYANETDRYVLFQKDKALYLYDSKNKDVTSKIADDVVSYSFSEDDKYIIIFDSEYNLRVYNFKDLEKIEADVSQIIKIQDNKIIYEKEHKIYVRSINPKKEDRKKVTEAYDSNMRFSEDTKNILYINSDKELISYNISKDKEEKIASDVTNYYCDTKSCERLFYIENKDAKAIYYYDGKDGIKVAKDIYNINAASADSKKVVYSKMKDGEYTLYYQMVGKDEVKIEGKLTSIRTVKMFEDKEIYYINGKNEVKYVKINGAKVGDVKKLGEDVSGYLYLHKNGYAFVADVDKSSNGELYIASNGKAKKIDKDVNSSLITVSKDGKSLYYMKDYSSSGNLYVTNGGKGKKIDDDVFTFEYIKNDLIYYIKDYSSNNKFYGDLYRYTGKSTKIAEGVTRIANVPVYYESN